jgi:homocysteine S-methyltransferase
MINCAHPAHFAEQLNAGADWLARVKAIRANASRCSHAELDEATELDRGDVADLAGWYQRLNAILPDLRVVGGCCGTDHEHVAAIAESLAEVRS